MEDKIIIALEIGSSKIKGAIGAVTPDGGVNVNAVEEEPITDIVRYGCIRNILDTDRAVRKVIDKLELRMTPRKIQGVYLNIGGRSLTSRSIEVERHLPAETIISDALIKEITDEALEVPLDDRAIVTVTPSELLVDNAATPRPIGTVGSHVVGRFNLVSCRSQLLRNLATVIEDRLGLKITGTFARPLAIADLVLTNEDKKLGCMLVDFGAETTTVAIYRSGALVHLAVLPLGSRNITRDITTLNYVEDDAEELKRMGGSALTPTEQAYSPQVAPGQTDFAKINRYVSARASEIIYNIVEQIKYAFGELPVEKLPDMLPKGIIIVGGGLKLSGFMQRLKQESKLEVRVGMPGNRLRILDGRIRSEDSVDVLAIINAAAKNNPQECISPRPEAPKPPVKEEEEDKAKEEEKKPTTGTATTPDAPKPSGGGSSTETGNYRRPNKPKGTNIFMTGYNILVKRVSDAITKGFDEEDDE